MQHTATHCNTQVVSRISTRMKESCPTYEWAMSHISMRHVPLTNESCPIFESLLARKKSCLTYEWVTSHIAWVTIHYMWSSWLLYLCRAIRLAPSHTWMSHKLHIFMSHDAWVSIHQWISHGSQRMRLLMSHMWSSHVSLQNKSLHAQNVTRVNESRPTCEQVVAHERMRHEWRSHTWVSHVWRMNELRHANECVFQCISLHTAQDQSGAITYERVMSHMWMSHVAHVNESCHTYKSVRSSHVWKSHVTHLNKSYLT